MSCAYDLYSSDSHQIIKQLCHDKREIESNKYDQLCNRIEDRNRLVCLLKHRQPVVCNPKAGEAGMPKEAWESDEDSDGAILPDQDYRSSILASGSLVSKSRWRQMFQRSLKKRVNFLFLCLIVLFNTSRDGIMPTHIEQSLLLYWIFWYTCWHVPEKFQYHTNK